MFIGGIVIVIFKDLIFLMLESSYSAAGLASFLLLMPILETVSYVTTVGINFKKKHIYILELLLLL